MNNQKDNEYWTTEKIKCDLCAYVCVSVHLAAAEKIECFNCGNMTSFEVLEIDTNNKNEPNR